MRTRIHTPNDEKPAKNLIPGDVIHWRGELRLVVSQDFPATTVPSPENEKYCEPGMVVLGHQREDLWVRTHIFTYMLFRVDEVVELNNAVRVQMEYRRGPFQNYAERTGIEKDDE